jgi:hypothetical protein
MHVNNELARRQKFESSVSETTLTGKEILQTRRDLYLFGGNMQFKKFHGVSQGEAQSAQQDAYYFNKETACGKDLTEINFRGVIWQRNTNNIQIGYR